MAAYGGVVFPLALIIESPIIMLLAASTALSKDWASYRLIRRFMMTAGALLTLLHILIAFTPLYYFVVVDIMGAKPQIVEPARIGLMIMLPWTWSIAYRRFNQGVLIRIGHSRSVGLGTVVRLSANLVVLAIGYTIGSILGHRRRHPSVRWPARRDERSRIRPVDHPPAAEQGYQTGASRRPAAELGSILGFLYPACVDFPSIAAG